MLPTISHLQYAIIQSCSTGFSGEEVRERLAKTFQIKKSGPSFYQLMGRLEEAKLVRGFYGNEVIKGHTRRKRYYRVTKLGIEAAMICWHFYAECQSPIPKERVEEIRRKYAGRWNF